MVPRYLENTMKYLEAENWWQPVKRRNCKGRWHNFGSP